MFELVDQDSRTKIGLGLLATSGLLFFLGVMLFFNRSLLIIANMLFLSGLYFFVGLKKTVGFFVQKKKSRMQGSALYFGGFLIMVVLKLALIGFITQIAGIIFVFRDFLPWLKSYTFAIPVVGKYLRTLIDFLSPDRKSSV